MQSFKNILSKMPSIFWVVIIPLALALFLGTIIFLFFLVGSVEGVASIIILVIAIAIMRVSSSPYTLVQSKQKSSQIGIALIITFFALMGMAIDQPGNYVYNKPLDIIFCKEETTLSRSIEISHPLPERTDITQGFYCVDDEGVVKKTIGIGYVLLVRFIEYVIIGYILMYANIMYNNYKYNKKLSEMATKTSSL